MKYFKMDTLRACITDKDIFMYISGKDYKIAPIKDNELYHGILLNQEVITEKEFSDNIETETIDHTLFKLMYLKAKSELS